MVALRGRPEVDTNACVRRPGLRIHVKTVTSGRDSENQILKKNKENSSPKRRNIRAGAAMSHNVCDGLAGLGINACRSCPRLERSDG